MSTIISAGTTTGTALNVTPDTSGNLAFQTQAGANTITVPNTTGTLALTGAAVAKSQLPAGTVLQVVFGSVNTGGSSTTTNSWFDTGLSASITPTSATSKILIIVNQQIDINASGSDGQANVQVLRNSTAITGGGLNWDQLRMSLNSISGGFISWSYPVNYLDSPATTSAITYKAQASLRTAGTLSVQKAGNPSYITLLEVAA
jgi:hypothetical protein